MTDFGYPLDGDTVRRQADRVAAEVTAATDAVLRLAWHSADAAAARADARRQRDEGGELAAALRAVAADLDRRATGEG